MNDNQMPPRTPPEEGMDPLALPRRLPEAS